MFNVLRVPLDFTLLLGAGLFVYALRTRVLDAWRPVLFSPDLPFGRFIGLTALVSLLFLAVYAAAGLYGMKMRMTRLQEATRIVVASSAAIMLVILTIFLRQELFNSRFLVVGYWAAAVAFVLVGRTTIRAVYQRIASRYGIGGSRVLLIGDDETAQRLVQSIGQNPALGYRIVERLADLDLAQVAATIGGGHVDEVLLASPDYPADRIIPLVDLCHDRHVTFMFVPNIHQTLTTHWDVDAIGRTPVVQLRRTSLDGWGRVFKRAVDIVASAGALVVLSPVLVAVALAIKWETAGPVLVRLERVSRAQRFGLLKFRSMIENAEELKPLLAQFNERVDGPLFKMRRDPRVTFVGQFLRRYRLDELPQFYNILVGDIALVGPRPHQPDEIARYTRHHRKVLAIKAGATGLAQVSGSSDLPFEEEVALDSFYIENWSLWLDLRVVLRTIGKVLTDRSAV